MFDVQNVSLSFGERVILDNGSFKVEDGERAAIIGPNGTGKSTLLKIIAGLISPEKGQISFPKTTEIGYLPQDLELNSDLTVLEECRTVFQEVLEHEKEMRVLEDKMSHVPHGTEEFDQIADRYEYLMHETHRRDLYSMDSTIGKVLDGLGFRVKDQSRPCSEFSGGWQMRILLAKLLLQNPDILLLDEPTNHLDIESIEWLGDWITQHEGSVLMVSHERAFMDKLVNKVIEIDRGKVIQYRGNYTDAIQKRAERRENQQRQFENQQREIAHIQVFIDRFRYQASKAAMVQSRVKMLEKIERVEAPIADLSTIHFRFPPAPRSAKEVVVAENITKAFGKNVIINNVELTIYRGEKVALVGHNGAGKTTLMRILAGRDKEAEGSVRYGSNVDIAYFAQYDTEDLHPENTVLGEFVSNAPLSVSEKARGILGAFLFSGDDIDKKIKVLSGGERTRLRLARMLCGKANLLMLDEPTNHLDIGSRLTLEEALRQYDGAVLLVSHDRYFLDNVVNRVVEVSDGKLTSYQGNYAEYLQMKAFQDQVGARAAADAKAEAKAEAKAARAAAAGPQLRSLSEAAVLDTPPAAHETPEERRERNERHKVAKNRQRKLEKEIADAEALTTKLDKRVQELEAELAKPSVSSNYQKVAELSTELASTKAKKEEAEMAWLELQEEMTKVMAELG